MEIKAGEVLSLSEDKRVLLQLFFAEDKDSRASELWLAEVRRNK